MHQAQTDSRGGSPAARFISSCKCLFWLNIHDTQCGAKVMKREVVEKIHSTSAHRRHGVRHQPARRHQARGLPHPRSADRMDGQGRLEGHVVAVPLVADDVPVRRAHPADLLAVLQIAAPVAPAGRLDLQKTPRAAAAAPRSQVQSPKSKVD